MATFIKSLTTFNISADTTNSTTKFLNANSEGNIQPICEIGATGIINYVPITPSGLTSSNPTLPRHIGYIKTLTSTQSVASNNFTWNIIGGSGTLFNLDYGTYFLNAHINIRNAPDLKAGIWIGFNTTNALPSTMPFANMNLYYGMTSMFGSSTNFNIRTSLVITISTSTLQNINLMVYQNTGSAITMNADMSAMRLA